VNEEGKLDHANELLMLELARTLWVARTTARLVLPMLSEAIEDDELKRVADDHRAATTEQEHNLVRVFALFGEKPRAERSPVLDAIAEEHEAAIAQVAERSLSDLVHASALRRAGHYELALYEQLIELAGAHARGETARLLEENRLQEQRTLDRIDAATERLRGVLTAR
jgi:ferritin-like metal-binding protein YciE